MRNLVPLTKILLTFGTAVWAIVLSEPTSLAALCALELLILLVSGEHLGASGNRKSIRSHYARGKRDATTAGVTSKREDQAASPAINCLPRSRPMYFVASSRASIGLEM